MRGERVKFSKASTPAGLLPIFCPIFFALGFYLPLFFPSAQCGRNVHGAVGRFLKYYRKYYRDIIGTTRDARGALVRYQRGAAR